jgi:hypothetical protein
MKNYIRRLNDDGIVDEIESLKEILFNNNFPSTMQLPTKYFISVIQFSNNV